MKRNNKSTPLRPMLAALVLSLTACASGSPNSLQQVEPPAIPPLSAQARASLVATPSMCSSTCSAGLTALRENLANMPTDSGSPGLPASAATMRSAGSNN